MTFRKLRSGFALPASLVLTFLTLTIVGASAHYCTTSMRTSNEYLARTQCRLAAQSAIEMAKVAIRKRCHGNTMGVTDVAGTDFGKSLADTLRGLKSGPEFVEVEETLRRMYPDFKFYFEVQPDEDTGIHRILATAEVHKNGKETAVTLQECFSIPLSEVDLFRYAYFVNGDGRLISKYLTVNGDVRSNGDFYLSGANINGFIYASNTVHLADASSTGKTWWDGRFVTARTARSYNRSQRVGKYARARPTNPLSDGKEWIGGYEAPREHVASTLLGRIVQTLIKGLIQIAEALTGREGYDDGELIITSSTRDYYKPETDDEGLVKDNAGGIAMPRITFDTPTGADMDLDDCINYAYSATTPKNNTGGSLICSNCFVNAQGQVEQFSAKMLLPPDADALRKQWEAEHTREIWDSLAQEEWNKNHTREIWDAAHTRDAWGKSYTEYIDDDSWGKDIPSEAVGRSGVAAYVPPNGVLVYNAITAADYANLTATEKTKWSRFKPSGTDLDPAAGAIGEISTGWVGKIEEGNHLGAFLMFNDDDFKQVLNKEFNMSASTAVQAKFQEPSWSRKWATYGQKQVTRYTDGVRGAKSVYHRSIKLLEYKTRRPKITEAYKDYRGRTQYREVDDSSWTALNSGRSQTAYYRKGDGAATSTSYCFKESSLSMVSTAIKNESSSKKYNLGTKPVTCDWTDDVTSGYYKDTNIGYLVYDIVEHYETGKSTYYTVESAIVRADVSGFEDSEEPIKIPKQDNVDYYSGYYYRPDPAGYVELSYDSYMKPVPTIKATYHPFTIERPQVDAIRKLVDTKYLEMHSYSTYAGIGRRRIQDSSGYIKRGYQFGNGGSLVAEQWGGNGSSESEMTLSKLVEYLARYSLYENEVLAEFAGDDWTLRTSGYYQSAVSEYLACHVYGVFIGGSVDHYELVWEVVSTARKQEDEKASPDSDVIDIVYLPLHEYGDTLFSGGNPILSSDEGYVSKKSGSRYYYCYFTNEELETAVSTLDGAYGFTEADIRTPLTSKDPYGWQRPEQAIFSYGTYSSSISGYVTIKVVRVDSTSPVSYKLEFGYADAKPGDTASSLNRKGVKDGMIPVYTYATRAEWLAMDYQEKKQWCEISKVGSGYRNTDNSGDNEMYNRFFLTKDLTTIANLRKTQNSNNDKARQLVMELFETGGDAYDDGWRSGCNSGFVTSYPTGYLEVKIESDTMYETDFKASYNYLSADDGDIMDDGGYDAEYYKNHPDLLDEHLKEIGKYDEVMERYNSDFETWRNAGYDEWLTDGFDSWSETWYENWKERGFEEWLASKMSESVLVQRELRRVFVKSGNALDDGNVGVLATKEQDINDITAFGSTTAALRPFRDDGFHSNALADEADRGAVILIGTWDHPIMIDGPVVFTSDVLIRGFVTGRGTIYSGRNIHIIGDINYKNPPFWPETGVAPAEQPGRDLLMLVSRGSIVIGNYLADTLWKDGNNSLLGGGFIRGEEVTSKLANGSISYKEKYTHKNYTAKDSRYRKVVYDKNTCRISAGDVSYYESVVGDFVFMSKLGSDGQKPEEGDKTKGALHDFGSSCLFSQHWDYNVSLCEAGELPPFAGCQSSAVEDYVNACNWDVTARGGATSAKSVGTAPRGKAFCGEIWDPALRTFKTDYTTYCRNNFYTKFNTQKPRLNCIRTINAVLYASEAVFGIIGGQKTPCVINGALIAHEEALLPFARYRRVFFISQSEDLTLSINWDIRLNKKSSDSVQNGEYGSGFSNSMQTEGNETPGEPRTLSWQEVPNDFNGEYNSKL